MSILFRVVAITLLVILSDSSVGFAQTDSSFPFVIPGDDAHPGVTSRAALLEKPAGKHGFVRVRNAHFHAGENRIRFWGVNLCFAANFPSHEDADFLAPHLAKLGVNAVRFHHMDNQAAPSGIWSAELRDGQRVFDDEMVDRLDYLLARLHENGIYADLNLHCSRQLTEREGYPKLVGVPWWAVSNKWVMYYDRSVQEQVKRYCRDLLTHRNPYRENRRRVDDPGIALVEMMNENYFSKQGYALYRKLPARFQRSLVQSWNRWLVGRYGDTAGMMKKWTQRQTRLEESVADGKSWKRGPGDWKLSPGEPALEREFGVNSPEESGRQSAVRLRPLRVTEKDHEQNLSFPNLETEKGKPYTLEYWVRSDESRPYRAELSSDRGGEWRALGLFESMESMSEWTKITRVIFPQESVPDDVTLKFSFGSSTVPIEFAGLTLSPGAKMQPLPSDQSLEARTVAIPSALSPVAAHADMREFMEETELAWVNELKRYLREDLGVQVPITASQVNYHTSSVNEQANDFVDLHNYWHHPLFPSDAQWDPARWTVGNEPMEADPTRSSWPANSLLMRTGWRWDGKPMTLTEWNYPEPSPYSSGCVPMAACLAALQDWDAVFFFDYDAGAKTTSDWTRDQTVNFFSFNGQPVKLANLSVFANVFLRGDLAPLKRKKVAPVDQPIDGTQALSFRLAVSTDAKRPPDLKPQDTTSLSSPKARLTWQSEPPRNGHLSLDTAKTQGVWGTISGGTYQTSNLKIQVGTLYPNYATIVATSQSSSSIEKSKRIVLLASRHSENQGMQWNQDRNSVGTDWGTGPTQVAGVKATVTLRSAVAKRVFALNGKGQRTFELPVRKADGGITVELLPKYETLWYEITEKKPPPKPFKWINQMPDGHHESLIHRTFSSSLAGEDVGYTVLLPEGYDATDRRYPVVYYLHGGRPGSEVKSAKLAEHLIRLRESEELDPVIYVFVNGGPVSHYNVPDQMGVEGKPDANGADVFIKELIPHIDANFRTIAKRDARGLEGFSQGGRGTMRLSLRYPELFSSVAAGGGGYETERKISESPDSAESPTLRFARGDNTWDLARDYAARSDAPPIELMIYVGTRGFNYENNLSYMKFLEGLGLKYRSLIVPDVPHSATMIYEANGLEIMRFHAANFSRALPENSAKADSQ